MPEKLPSRLEQEQAQTDWEILGLPEGSTLEEIKSAYRKAALKNHPDLNKDKTSEDLRKVTDAYHRLAEQFRESKNKKTDLYESAIQPDSEVLDLNDPDSDVDLWE